MHAKKQFGKVFGIVWHNTTTKDMLSPRKMIK